MELINRMAAISAIAVMALGISACSTDSSTSATTPTERQRMLEDDISHKLSADELAAMHAQGKAGDAVQASVTYEAHLCPDEVASGDVIGRFSSAENFVYYSFDGKGGSSVTIKVDRTDCNLDPGITLARGKATVTTGIKWSSSFFNSAELRYLTRNDDFNVPACTTACGEDPEITYTLPFDDVYTVMVYRVGTFCDTTDATGFTISVTGDGIIAGDDCPVDSDGDGINDDEDAYPDSDTQPTVSIDGCSSGVDNEPLSDGAFMMDLINECAANAANHGAFVSCVTQLANDWKAAGLISGNQKSSITGCASSSSLP